MCCGPTLPTLGTSSKNYGWSQQNSGGNAQPAAWLFQLSCCLGVEPQRQVDCGVEESAECLPELEDEQWPLVIMAPLVNCLYVPDQGGHDVLVEVTEAFPVSQTA